MIDLTNEGATGLIPGRLTAALAGIGLLLAVGVAAAEDDFATKLQQSIGPMVGAEESASSGPLEAVSSAAKAIKVRGAGDNQRGGRERATRGGLEVDIRATDSRYYPNDAIAFEVKGNKDFHLYLFNVDPRTERVTTILPNQRQTNRRIRYKGGRDWYKVPNPGVEFYSDSAGKERVVMVASEKYLDVDRLLSSSGTKALGANFYESTDALDWLDTALNEAYPATDAKGTEPKRIRVREGGQRSRSLPNGVVIKEFDVRIDRP